MKKITYFIILITSLIFFKTKAQNLKELDSVANSIIDIYKVKGIAIVGVKGNEVIYSKGFGYANDFSKMDNQTPLYIASNTKAFIGLAMSQLVHSGEIHLNDPMLNYIDKKYFPSLLKLEQITIKDLLGHNHGLSNDALTFRTAYSGEYPKNLQKLLKFTSFSSDTNDLKKEYNYGNFGYILAGIIIKNVTGKSWGKYLKNNILTPLNMESTKGYIPRGSMNKKMALPYTFSSKLPLKSVKSNNTLHAAGGLFSNLDDMGKWLSFIVSPNKARQIDLNNYPEILVENQDNFGPLAMIGYGYGWNIGTYLGKKYNYHTGNFPGYASYMSYMPEEKLAFFAFMNEKEDAVKMSVIQLALLYYNIMTESPAKGQINGTFSGIIKRNYEKFNPKNFKIINPNTTKLPLGKFTSQRYGTLKISKSNEGYELSLGKNLKSYAYLGKKANEIVVEFTPGIIEHLFVEYNKKGVPKIKYEDNYGYFLKN